jgi:glyoxylase-like metal-dependent hydrolase (beta-lactamase superfamily II)
MVKQFQGVDRAISKIMQEKDEIDQLPENIEHYNFSVDRTITEGERIDLGQGVSWTMHAIPGHSACQHAFFEEGEKVLAIGDATGFYNPELKQFWPNYFESLPQYVSSIRSLAGFGAQRILLSHNGCIESDVNTFLANALCSTGDYHHEMIERVVKGESVEEIAKEKAKWVYSIADHMPFMIMTFLCQVLINQSVAQQEMGSIEFAL